METPASKCNVGVSHQMTRRILLNRHRLPNQVHEELAGGAVRQKKPTKPHTRCKRSIKCAARISAGSLPVAVQLVIGRERRTVRSENKKIKNGTANINQKPYILMPESCSPLDARASAWSGWASPGWPLTAGLSKSSCDAMKSGESRASLMTKGFKSDY